MAYARSFSQVQSIRLAGEGCLPQLAQTYSWTPRAHREPRECRVLGTSAMLFSARLAGLCPRWSSITTPAPTMQHVQRRRRPVMCQFSRSEASICSESVASGKRWTYHRSEFVEAGYGASHQCRRAPVSLPRLTIHTTRRPRHGRFACQPTATHIEELNSTRVCQ